MPKTAPGKWLLEEYARTPGDPKWHPGFGLESTIEAIEDEAFAAGDAQGFDAGLDALLDYEFLARALASVPGEYVEYTTDKLAEAIVKEHRRLVDEV